MNARRSRERGATPVPAYFLYGEPLRATDERLVHVETVAARSGLHDWVIRPHRHRDLLQVLLTQQGQVEARVDGPAATLRAPAAILVPPGAVHAFAFERDTRGLVISVSADLARELATPAPGLQQFLECAAAAELEGSALASTDLDALGDMLLREFGRSAPGRYAALRGLLGALFANLLRLTRAAAAPARADSPRERELVARFRRCIERRFREHAAIAVYAAELGVSAAQLRRACIAETGAPPAELVQRRVLIEAERQLRYTSMSVAQVAYHLGFDDPAYFTRFFTRRTGVAPRAFRVLDAIPAPTAASR